MHNVFWAVGTIVLILLLVVVLCVVDELWARKQISSGVVDDRIRKFDNPYSNYSVLPERRTKTGKQARTRGIAKRFEEGNSTTKNELDTMLQNIERSDFLELKKLRDLRNGIVGNYSPENAEEFNINNNTSSEELETQLNTVLGRNNGRNNSGYDIIKLSNTTQGTVQKMVEEIDNRTRNKGEQSVSNNHGAINELNILLGEIME